MHSSPSSCAQSACDLHLDEVLRFARECQLAAPLFAEAHDTLELLAAAHRIVAAYPAALPAPEAARAATALVEFSRRMFGRDARRRPAGAVSMARRRSSDALEQVLQLYDSGFLSLRAVAMRLDVSVAYLCAVLMRTTGYGFVAHLHTIRILRAVLVIAHGRMAIRDVARACGYHHTFQLDRQFRARLRITPGDFRRLLDGAPSSCRNSQHKFR